MDELTAMDPAPRIFLRRIAFASLIASVFIGAPAAAQQPPGIPILAYHRFDPATAGTTTVTMRAFTAQLSWLAQHGFRIVRLRDVTTILNRPGAGALPRAAAITIDDGHRSVYAVLYPLLRKLGTPVTLFIYPSAIGRASYALTWAQLGEMQASGLVDVQSHSYWHPDFAAERRRRKPADFQRFVDDQLRRSRAVIEAHLGKPVDMLAWPYGIVAPDLEVAAHKAGYAFAFAYEGGPARPGGDLLAVPRVPVADATRGDRLGTAIEAPAPAKRR
jgi:peptidoglycan/xylan/chitin deacetylase (PgdA/CDA1 family)